MTTNIGFDDKYPPNPTPKIEVVTLRDQFAMETLKKITSDDIGDLIEQNGQDEALNMVAVYCYKLADAMLKAREVNSKP